MLTINSIVYGLQYLFLVSSPLLFIQDLFKYAADPDLFLYQEPNPEDPLNKEAAIELQSNRRMFEQNVQKTMKGE